MLGCQHDAQGLSGTEGMIGSDGLLLVDIALGCLSRYIKQSFRFVIVGNDRHGIPQICGEDGRAGVRIRDHTGADENETFMG